MSQFRRIYFIALFSVFLGTVGCDGLKSDGHEDDVPVGLLAVVAQGMVKTCVNFPHRTKYSVNGTYEFSDTCSVDNTSLVLTCRKDDSEDRVEYHFSNIRSAQISLFNGFLLDAEPNLGFRGDKIFVKLGSRERADVWVLDEQLRQKKLTFKEDDDEDEYDLEATYDENGYSTRYEIIDADLSYTYRDGETIPATMLFDGMKTSYEQGIAMELDDGRGEIWTAERTGQVQLCGN